MKTHLDLEDMRSLLLLLTAFVCFPRYDAVKCYHESISKGILQSKIEQVLSLLLDSSILFSFFSRLTARTISSVRYGLSRSLKTDIEVAVANAQQ